MTEWTGGELDRITTADELEIQPQQADGTLRRPTTIWVVRAGDDLYVRSYRGSAGTWWRTAQASETGRVQAGGVTKDVVFARESDPEVNARVDAAYRSKYRSYGETYLGPMVADDARATTLSLRPQ